MASSMRHSLPLLTFSLTFSGLTYADTWACVPSHWVNLREDGPALNEGTEPPFILQLDQNVIATRGKNSWLDKGKFRINERLDLGGIIYYSGISEWGSQLSFSPTKQLFFHSSTSAGLSVSMTGYCNRS